MIGDCVTLMVVMWAGKLSIELAADNWLNLFTIWDDKKVDLVPDFLCVDGSVSF